MRAVQIRLFGEFKKYIPDGFIEIQIGNNCTIADIKKQIHHHLSENVTQYNKNLVFESALANDNEILNDETILATCQSYALLPPVCGG